MIMKVNIVYWSGTGNTEQMANAVAEGAKKAGADVALMRVSEAGSDALDCDALVLGCPAMGAEELEDTEFEPFFASLEDSLKGKKLGLFGSYEWGVGDWMSTWQGRCEADGASMICDGVIANGSPDAEALAACEALGEKAAG